MTDCLFCKIAKKEIPAQVVHENDHVLAFRDIRPMMPTHVLVIPKKHIVGMHELTREDAPTVAELFLGARDVAEKLGVHEEGYRVVVNNGADAGQSVFHLHVHVLAGRAMAWPPG